MSITTITTPQAKFEELIRLKEAAEAAKEAYKAAEQALIDTGFGLATIIDEDGNEVSFSVIAAEKEVVDEDKLRKLISPSRWTTISNRKVDLKKFRKARMDGKIAEHVVKSVVSFKTSAPYIKITSK